ncbi:hypothetical protein PGB90_003670 [Kerria lacca]
MFSIKIILLFITFTVVHSEIKTLNENNWDSILKGEWMVEFYAPWCPACKALQSTWEELSSLSNELHISIGQVDVTVSPGLSGRFIVTALPTIFHVTDGEFRQYRGSRDIESFLSFLKEKKWQEIQSIPSWKSPASYQMTVVAYFFKLSQMLRNIHSRLMEDYGLPTWGSYLIFAVATIFFGALLGLVIVFCIDFFYPPKLSFGSGTSVDNFSHKRKDSGDDEDEVEDEIIDESEKTASPPARKRRTARKAD